MQIALDNLRMLAAGCSQFGAAEDNAGIEMSGLYSQYPWVSAFVVFAAKLAAVTLKRGSPQAVFLFVGTSCE